MTRYLIARLLQGIVTVLILTTFVFFAARLTGSPLDVITPDSATPEQRAQIAHQLGLDRSTWEQFWIYVSGLFRGDLGQSYILHRSVASLYWHALPNSMELILPAFVVAIAVGVPLGVLSATAKSRAARAAIGLYSGSGMAAPTFWVGLLLISVFSVALRLLPSAQMGGPDHFILPVITLSFAISAGIIRMVRSAMIETLPSEYITFARIKGVSEPTIVWKHALRNALNATVAFLSVSLAALITGSLVVEIVFAWPGLGRLTYQAISSRDYPLAQGIMLMSGVLIVVLNLLFDIAQTRLDPRSRL